MRSRTHLFLKQVFEERRGILGVAVMRMHLFLKQVFGEGVIGFDEWIEEPRMRSRHNWGISSHYVIGFPLRNRHCSVLATPPFFGEGA